MSVEHSGGVIHLQGRCGIEDAEPLLEALISGSDNVDLTHCEHLHGAVLQLLMAARPNIVGNPAPFLHKWVVPLIKSL